MDVILNSYYFLDDILPAILQTLANYEGENPLFRAIAENGHRILVTDRSGRRSRSSIMQEYQSAAGKRGLGPQLVVALDQLEDQGLLVQRNAARRPIADLGGPHRVFIEDAVASGVAYFITENPPWLRLNRNRRICPELSILSAGRFIRVANRHPT